MNEVLFYQHKMENILDQLTNLFKDKGEWKLNDSSHRFYHAFEWPDIILADRKRDFQGLDENAIELLGSYAFNDIEKVGQVTLYKPTILSCADEYLKSLGLTSPSFEDRKKFIEILSEIVLIHEFVHWLVDVGESPTLFSNNTKENCDLKKDKLVIKYIEDDEIAYHESFAQIFTNYYCNLIGGEHWAVFSWLQEQQPKQYVIYKDLFDPVWGGRDLIYEGIFPEQKIEKIDERHLGKVFDLLNFTREIDCQSFEVLKVLSTNYSENDKESKCRGFFEKIIKSNELKDDCFDKIVEKCKLLHSDLVDTNKGRITGKKYGL
jgi:hypothetical protein